MNSPDLLSLLHKAGPIFGTFFQDSNTIGMSVILLSIFLKLYLNHEATDLEKKECYASIPSEITLMLLGVVALTKMTLQVIIYLLVWAWQYVSFTNMKKGQLVGHLQWSMKRKIIFHYCITILLYWFTIFYK